MSNEKPRQPKRAPDPVRSWLLILNRRRQSARVHIPRDDLLRLAALLTLVGEPGSEDGRRAFHALTGLLFHPKRKSRLGRALEKIPPTREAVLRIAEALRAWAQVTGRTLERERFRVDDVIHVMVQVPDVGAYVRHLDRRGFTYLGQMFHPGTLRHAPKYQRGVFGGTEGDGGYWERTKDDLNIVRD